MTNFISIFGNKICQNWYLIDEKNQTFFSVQIVCSFLQNELCYKIKQCNIVTKNGSCISKILLSFAIVFSYLHYGTFVLSLIFFHAACIALFPFLTMISSSSSLDSSSAPFVHSKLFSHFTFFFPLPLLQFLLALNLFFTRS